MNGLEERIEDLISVGEAIAKALREDKGAEVTVNVPEAKAPVVHMPPAQVHVSPQIKVEGAPVPPPADVTVNIPDPPVRKPCAYEVNVLEWGGPDRRISKMTFTPIE